MLKTQLLVKILMVLFVSSGIMMLSSCYPDDNLSVSETDVIMTGYYDSVDFKSLKTYIMSDTVYPVRDDTSDHSLIKYNDDIIHSIASNMASYGYTRVYDTALGLPNVKIKSASITVKNISVGYWYPYYPGWGWRMGYKSGPRSTEFYRPGFYPGFYPPGYWPPQPYYTSYTTGTLLIEMANPEDHRIVGIDTIVPVYWSAGINGVLTNSDKDRIIELIDKSFELSPQIKAN